MAGWGGCLHEGCAGLKSCVHHLSADTPRRCGQQVSRGSVLRTEGEAGLLEAGPAADDNLPVPTILIVDDHVQFRITARALLECDGFDVVGEAPTGAAGLDAARALRPDVVLLDVRLPDIDGFAVAERMTAGGQGPAVILTSSSDDPLYPERAVRSGARGFVAKHDLCRPGFSRMLH